VTSNAGILLQPEATDGATAATFASVVVGRGCNAASFSLISYFFSLRMAQAGLPHHLYGGGAMAVDLCAPCSWRTVTVMILRRDGSSFWSVTLGMQSDWFALDPV
jgi:hypothetical protein